MSHPVVHFEFWSPDPDKLGTFYKDVFDWDIQHVEGLKYWPIQTRGEGGIHGGMFKPEAGPLPAKLSLYIQVDDMEAALEKATSNGATTIVPPMEIPGVGWSAIFLDPEERAIGIYKPAESVD